MSVFVVLIEWHSNHCKFRNAHRYQRLNWSGLVLKKNKDNQGHGYYEGGLMSMTNVVASWLVSLSLDQAVQLEPWPGTLCCVLGQDT